MFRPLMIDLLAVLLLLAIGGVALVVGWRLHRCGRPWFLGGVMLSLLFSMVVVLSGTAFQDQAGTLIHRLGGAVLLGCFPGCFLMGVVWGNPRRTFSNGFCGFLTALLMALVVMAGGGRLMWRCFATSMWENTADKNGCLLQSSGMTCAPAAAAMLLHHLGIHATEGEIAYLSNTSLFGNTLHGMTETLDLKVQPLGLKTRVGRLNYEEAQGLGGPFMAQSTTYGIKGHAIYVERVEEDHVVIIDPLQGHRARLWRQEFERKWNGRSLWVAKAPR